MDLAPATRLSPICALLVASGAFFAISRFADL